MPETPTLKKTVSRPKSHLVDQQEVLRALAELNQTIGFVPDDSVSIEELHRQMIAAGVKPEENGASREMIAMRCPDEQVE